MTRINLRRLISLALFSLLAGCGSAGSTERIQLPAPTSTTPAQVATEPAPEPTVSLQNEPVVAATVSTTADEDELASVLMQRSLQRFEGAGAIDFTLIENGGIYVAYTRDRNVYVARSADAGATFAEPVMASQAGNVFVYPIERPAIAVGADGRVHVAWVEDDYPGSVWYALSADGGHTFGPSLQLSEPGPETVLVRLLMAPADVPYAAWLQNSQLHFVRGDAEGAFASAQVLDGQTCDCCHPQLAWHGSTLVVAYRNLVVEDDGRQVRDIYAMVSADGGATFGEPVRVSDAPWYLNACPFSGPSLVSDGGQTIYVSWMDGRNDTLGGFGQSDIWLATSGDGGQTFSANRRLNETIGGFHNLPSLALDASGRLHLLWQAEEEAQRALYYTSSGDGGQTFDPPQVVVDDGTGRPTNATLHVDGDGVIYASWVDGTDGYLAVWQVDREGDGE